MIFQLETEKKKKAKEEQGKSGPGKLGGLSDRQPASWRWEKQDLERQIKDLKKKIDDRYTYSSSPETPCNIYPYVSHLGPLGGGHIRCSTIGSKMPGSWTYFRFSQNCP